MRRLAKVGVVGSVFAGTLTFWALPALAATASPTFAGYSATLGTITSSSGTLTVPTVNCSSITSGTVSMMPEIFLGTNDSGTGAVGVGLSIVCASGSANYQQAFAFVQGDTARGTEMAKTEVSIRAGDTIRYSVQTSRPNVKVKLVNSTGHFQGSATGPMAGKIPGVVHAGTTFLGPPGPNVVPIPSFTPMNFGSLKFNASSLSSLSPTEFEMFNGSDLQVSTSSVTTSGSFQNTFVAAS